MKVFVFFGVIYNLCMSIYFYGFSNVELDTFNIFNSSSIIASITGYYFLMSKLQKKKY